MRMRPRVPLIVAALLALGSPLLAQTTGRIAGEITDSSGLPVPGATVTVRSPRLQGARSATTDARGEFRLAFLPPGTYGVKAELAGFPPAAVEAVRVDIDRTATLHVRLEVAEVRETVDVSAPPPEIDVTNTATGLNVTADLYTRIPLDRSFFAVARVAPGTQEDEMGTAFYGSTGAENQYVVDGLNVTGTINGSHREQDLNFDFVEEVEVKTGGLPAEYGRSTGGILNVLTKSGANELHGGAFGFFAGQGLHSDDRTAASRPGDTTTIDETTSRWDFGAELGGRIVRDRLWFFAAFNRVATDTATLVIRDLEGEGVPGAGSVVPGQKRDNRFAGKLTWRPASSSSVTLSAFGDPNRFAGAVRPITGPPSTYLGTIDASRNTDVTLRYDGTFGGSVLVHGLFGQHRERRTLGGPGAETARFDDRTVSPTASTGGLGPYHDSSARRDVYKLDLSKFLSGHELKLGGDVEALGGAARQFVSGADYVAKLVTADGVDYYQHYVRIDDRAPGYARDDPSTWQPANPVVSAPQTRNTSAYVQDAWRLRRNLTLNLGLRFERQRLEDRDGKTPLAVDNWAPRFGLAWDPAGDGKGKVYGAFGRYFESIPQLIQFLAFNGLTAAFSYNFDGTAGAYAPDATAPQRSYVFGGDSTAVAAGIGGQYVDEWLLGFEREVGGHFTVGVKGSWRRLGRVIEDVDTGEGEYLFGNPGEGPASTLAFLDGSAVSSPRAERHNYSLEATARKRLSSGWQILASYVFTRLRGNYDGSFDRSSSREAAPNWNSGFDYADFLVNADGPLTSESVHQLKADGSYELRRGAPGLNLGLSTHWYSGWPENAYGLSVNYLNWIYYLAPRGSLGRNPADFEIDLHAGYPIRLARAVKLTVQADLFNVLDRQAILSYDQRYNLFPGGPCGGLPAGLCNGDGGLATQPGTLVPLGAIGDPRRTATNPDYLRKGTIFTSPRSLRLGVRLTF